MNPGARRPDGTPNAAAAMGTPGWQGAWREIIGNI
jgi:hypothetical protein